MVLYTRYIIGRIFGPLLLIVFSLTGIVWLIQSLRFIDFIVNRGLDVTMFLYLSSLLIPSLLGLVLPIGLFISVLIAYNKLSVESELVVLKSAGLSKFSLIKPAIYVAIWITLFGYFISLYLLPSSYREFKDLQNYIRDNYVSILLQEGVFNSPTTDLTVYIRKIEEGGNLQGMLVHDRRVSSKPVTMMAERGKLIRTQQGPRFILINGNRQEIDQKQGQISLLYFDRYAVDLSTFAPTKSKRVREPEERYFNELFNPDDGTPEHLLQKLRTEGHNRVTWPLYNIFLTLLALLAFITGQFNRRGQWQRILTVSIASLFTIGTAITIRNLVAKNIQLESLMYLFVSGGILVCLYLLLSNPQKTIKQNPLGEL